MEQPENLNDRQFSSLEDQLLASEQQAEIAEDSERMDAISSIRSAAKAIGLSPNKIRHATDSDAKEGDKVSLASYDEGSKEFKAVGADRLIEGAENAGMNVTEFTKAVFNHEKTHEKSRTADGVRQTDQILVHLFGEEAIHNTEEAAASQAEGATKTSKFDAYDTERSETERYATQLGIGDEELLKIRVSGDYRELLKHVLTSGMMVENDNEAIAA